MVAIAISTISQQNVSQRKSELSRNKTDRVKGGRRGENYRHMSIISALEG